MSRAPAGAVPQRRFFSRPPETPGRVWLTGGPLQPNFSRCVWKYALCIGPQTLTVPGEPVFVDAGMQGDMPAIWLMVNPDAPRREVEFLVVATGEPFDPAGFRPLRTLIMRGGMLIYHVFVKES